MAVKKNFFEAIDSELIAGQTFVDILHWLLLAFIVIDWITLGNFFATWFSNFGFSDKGYFITQLILFSYAIVMVFTESKHVKNVISALGFFSMLGIAVVATNSNSKALNTIENIKSTVSSKAANFNSTNGDNQPSFQYQATVTNPELVNEASNTASNTNKVEDLKRAWLEKAKTWGYCSTGVSLTKAMLQECRHNAGTNKHWQVNCGSGVIHNPPGKKGCPAN